MGVLCWSGNTGGAAIGILQCIVVCFMIASSSVILDRYQDWEDLEPNRWERRPTPMPSTPNPDLYNVTVHVIPSIWSEAWMEFQLAEHLGFCAVWLFSLGIYALTFRYWMPVMVMPNLFVLIMSLIVTLVLASAIMIRVLDVNKYYRLDDYEEAMLVYAMAFMFLWFFVQIIFLLGAFQFYKHVKKIDRRNSLDEHPIVQHA